MKAVRAMVHENLAYEDAAARLSTEPQLPQRRTKRRTSSMAS
jgi:hypothetical protein